jgi:hypothetical protein
VPIYQVACITFVVHTVEIDAEIKSFIVPAVSNFRSIPMATIQTVNAVVIKQVKVGNTGNRTQEGRNEELDYFHSRLVIFRTQTVSY